MVGNPVRVLLILPVGGLCKEFAGFLENTKFTVVGEASCGDDALDVLRDKRPQLAVIWVNTPGHKDEPGDGGIGVIRSLREADAKLRMVVVVDVDTKFLRVNAIKEGAHAAVSRPLKRDDVIRALVTAESARNSDTAIKRTDVRLRKPVEIRYKRASDGFFTGKRTGIGDDISPTGVGMRVPEALPKETVLKLELTLPGKVTIQARGKVVRSKAQVGMPMHEIGVTFTEIAPADVERLRTYILNSVAKGEKSY